MLDATPRESQAAAIARQVSAARRANAAYIAAARALEWHERERQRKRGHDVTEAARKERIAAEQELRQDQPARNWQGRDRYAALMKRSAGS